ncbi:MAG: glycosyltransferase, partial [Opitutales bacterium]|nr:glycosyltransferase [Opitutales bacterium]
MKRNRPQAVCLLTALPPGGLEALRGVVGGTPFAWRFIGPESLARTAEGTDWINMEELPPWLEPVVHFNQPFLENARRLHRWLVENPPTVCWVVGSAAPAFVALQSRASGGAHTGFRWLFTPVEGEVPGGPDPFPEGAMERFAARTTRERFDAIASSLSEAGACLAEWAAAEEPVSPCVAESPLISVCVAHFNYGAFLREQLDSLAAQTYPNLEVVVIDDGSTDAASLALWESLAETYDREVFRFIRRGENKGLSATRNEAVEAAKGEWIVICDADNRSAPDMVQRFWETAALTGADAVTGYNRHFRTGGPEGEETLEYFTPLGNCLESGWLFNVFGDANALFRKEAMVAAGGFQSPRGTTAEDWELFARLAWRGAKIEVVPEVLFYYRLHGDSVMRTSAWERSVDRVRAVYREQAADIRPERLRGFWSFIVGELPALHQWREEAGRLWEENRRLQAELAEARSVHERRIEGLNEDLAEARATAPVSWQAHRESIEALTDEIDFLRGFFREQLGARDTSLEGVREQLADSEQRIKRFAEEIITIWRSREEMDAYYKGQLASRDERAAALEERLAGQDVLNAQIWRSREEMDAYYKGQLAS